MTVTVTGSQLGPASFGLAWVSDAVGVTRWDIDLTAPVAVAETVHIYDLDARAFIMVLAEDNAALLDEGDTVTFEVAAQGAGESDTVDIVYSSSFPNPLYTSPRYTTVSEVKERLRIPAANTDLDARVTQAIVSAEYGIDAELGRSFPDDATPAIPVTVTKAATSIAMQIYKADDAPTGTAGGDSFYGELDVSELVRRELRGNPLLRGLHEAWGFA
jgi:hypothetical protein